MFNDDELIKIEPSEDYISQINARTKIIDILTKIETRQAYSDKLLDRELKDVEESDRRFIMEIVSGVLRWRLRLLGCVRSRICPGIRFFTISSRSCILITASKPTILPDGSPRFSPH